jgi:hypothetical protein
MLILCDFGEHWRLLASRDIHYGIFQVGRDNNSANVGVSGR